MTADSLESDGTIDVMNTHELSGPVLADRLAQDEKLDDSFDALLELTSRRRSASSAMLATAIVDEVPVYDASILDGMPRGSAREHALREEWCAVLKSGAGAFSVRGALRDIDMLDAVTRVFEDIIGEEADNDAKDHFAAAGANSRLWNAHEKLAVRDPELFVRYYSNRVLALASDAWLGPCYQVTAQVNVVRPGGEAQTAHRDYHLGFMNADDLARYPRHAHLMSANLTLQGALAHSNMPLESGPTRLLPYSQMWPPGYAASTREDVRNLFSDCFVQLPLEKGDALFFNPALLHAAGDNRTSDHHRFANLFQISSAFGRAMEIVDRTRLCRSIYPALLQMLEAGQLDADLLEDVIASAAEGYPFPANMDLDWGGAGLRPPSQQDILRDALAGRLSPESFETVLSANQDRARSH